VNEESSDGTPNVTIIGHLPVIESFGFDSYVKEQTSGQAFPNLSFSHWKQMDSKLKDNTVNKIRSRKNLKPEVPNLEQYNDKL
jgi:elongation factor 2